MQRSSRRLFDPDPIVPEDRRQWIGHIQECHVVEQYSMTVNDLQAQLAIGKISCHFMKKKNICCFCFLPFLKTLDKYFVKFQLLR